MGQFRQLRPVKVEETSPTEVRIDWADGHVSRWNYRDLRIGCQCAACRDEMTGKRLLDPASVPADIHPTRIDPIGSYALRFVWSDGHDTGMFPYDYLYQGGPRAAGPEERR